MKYHIFFFLIFISSISLFSQDQIEVYLKANEGHTDVVTDFVLSLDNKYVASCSEDKTIILWDFETEKEIKTIKGHENDISCVDINNDNSQIVAGEGGVEPNVKYLVKIWDVKTSHEIRRLKPNGGSIKLVKFLNQGKELFVGTQKKILLYNLETGSKIRDYTGVKSGFKNISLSKDSKFIAASDEKKAYLWDIEQREVLKTFESPSGKITALQLNSSGSVIYLAFEDNSIKAFNTISGEELSSFTAFRYPVIQIAVDEDQQIIAASDSKSKFFKIFDSSTHKEKQTIEAHAGRVGLIKITDNSQFIFTSGSWDRKIKLWNTDNGELVKTFSGIEKDIFEHAYIDSTSYSGIGKIRNRAFVKFMSKKAKDKVFKDKNGEVSCVALSRDKKRVAFGTSKNKTKIYDTKSEKELFSFDTQKSWIRELCFSNDDKLLATASFEQLKIWDIESGKEVLSIDDAFKVPYYVVFSKDRKRIAVGCRKAAKVFDVSTGKQLNSFKVKTIVYALDFSYDGKYLVAGEGFKTERDKYKITLWNLETGKSEKQIDGHLRQITAVKFSHGDSLIVSSGNKVIKVWNVTTGKLIREIQAHARWINDLEFSKDNSKFITTSQDGTVKIWNLNTGELLLTELGLKDSENWISYTPDGRFDGTNEGVKSLYFVKDMQIVPLENLYEQFYTPHLTADISLNEVDTNINIAKLQNLPEIKVLKPSADVPVFRGAVETLLATSDKTTRVSAKVTNRGGGIDEIRIYQNNKLVVSDKVTSDKEGESIIKDYDLNLSKGLNVIEIASYNKDRTKQSKRIGIEYTGDEFNPANLYVLAIGINEYKKSSYNLNYAVSDATAFTKALTQNSSAIFENTRVISLTNEQASKDSILASFQAIKDSAQQNDVFVFYYAGHGSMSVSEAEYKSEFFLIPWEITNLYSNTMLQEKGISAEQLQELSKEIKAQKQLFILDACQSGGAVEYLASRGSESEKAIAQLAHSTGTYFITASGSQQLAGEFGALGHGVFTYAVLEALKGAAQTKSKKVTVKGLTVFVEEEVPELSKKYKGNAQYPASYGFGQDFPIVLIASEKE